MPKFDSNCSQGSPSISYGFPHRSASGNNTQGHLPVHVLQPSSLKKRKAPQPEDGELRASKKVKTSNGVQISTITPSPEEPIRPEVSQEDTTSTVNPLFEKVRRPRLWDDRPECCSHDAAGPLSASQQRRIRTRIAASSTKQKTQKIEVVPWLVPEKVEATEASIISTAELEVEAVKWVFCEQLAAFANNTDDPVPDQPFRTWKNNEVTSKLRNAAAGGGVNGLIKSRHGNVIRPPKPPVPVFQKPDINKGRALSSAQLRQVMQCRARAPTEYKLYKPRYRVSKHLCPGQDSRTLPMNLLHRLRDSEPESVSLSEVAMMKELVRSHVDSIKKRRERRTAARLRVEKVKDLVFATHANTGELGSGPSIPERTERTHACSTVRSHAGNAGSSERTRSNQASEMTLEEMQQEIRRRRNQTPSAQTSKRKRDDDVDGDLSAPETKRPQFDDSKA